MDFPQLQVTSKALQMDLPWNMAQCRSKRTASKAKIRGQTQNQPLEKGWKHPCKQHDSRELCTPGRGEKLHSAVAGDEFPTAHISQLHFIDATALSSLLQHTWSRTWLIIHLQPPEWEILGSTTLPPTLLCRPAPWSPVRSSEISCPKEFPDFSHNSYRQNFFQTGSGYCKVPMPQTRRQLPTRSQEQGWAPWQWQLHEML